MCFNCLKKTKKAKQKRVKKNKTKDCACKESNKFLQGWCSIIDTWDCSSYCTWIKINLQFFSIRYYRGNYSEALSPFCHLFFHFHMNTCRKVFKKGITKQLPESWTEKKCSVAYFTRLEEGNGSLKEEKEVIFLHFTWEAEFFYTVWITPSVRLNHVIFVGKKSHIQKHYGLSLLSSLTQYAE